MTTAEQPPAHTPGPWVWIGPEGQGAVYYIYAGNPEAEAVLAMVYSATEGEADRENARLIAAAPRLLAALRDLVRVEDAAAAIIGRPREWKDSYLDEARAAIAEVEGAQP
jgi:hypothetical protein